VWSTPHAHYHKEAIDLGDEVVEQNLEVLSATESLSPKKTLYLFEVNKQWTKRINHLNRLSLKNNWLRFKTPGNLPIILEESMEYNPEWVNEENPERCEHVGSWAWQH
jgi:hypothetical protein